MKTKKTLSLVILMLVFIKLSGQTAVCGTSVSNSISKLTSPIVCSQLINDFVPTALDQDLEINVNIFVFQPNTGPGNWGTPTIGDVNYLLFTSNSAFSNIPLPKLPVSSVPHVPNSKIKLVLKSFQIIQDHPVYNNISLVSQNSSYLDPNAINVYFGNTNPLYPGLPYANLLGNTIVFPAGSLQQLFGQGLVLCHEVCHTLGLNHTNSVNLANFQFGCCNQLLVDDCDPELNLVWAACQDPFGSNNMVSPNAGCMKYLSPKQMAFMNFHLRNSMFSVLTQNSQNYVTNVNPAFDLPITSSQVWLDDKYLKGNVTVKTGNTLTIKCTVSMAKNARILVERGAKLVIDGGSVTNFFTSLWKGVELSGTSTLPQNYSGSYVNGQGVIEIINNGSIKNSVTAITTGTTDANNNFDWASTGGVIITNNAVFENNVRDVQFMYYTFTNKSSFTKTSFITNSQLRDNSTPVGRVSLYEVNGIGFRGCLFSYNAGNTYPIGSRGYGIYSIDASYNVDAICNINISPCTSITKTTIQDFDYGIKADNTNPLRLVTVSNSNIYRNNYDGVRFTVMNNTIFNNNTIVVGDQTNASGLYLNSCRYYNVRNNTFSSTSSNKPVGIYANNSLAGAHLVYRNSFSNLYMGIGALNDNSGVTNTVDGLKMNCNDFSSGTNMYDIAVLGNGFNNPSIAYQQGSGTSNLTVNNLYGAMCNNQNKFFVTSTSTKNILHPTHISANTQPLPQPGCSSPLLIVSTSVNNPINYSAECPEMTEVSGGGGSRSASLNGRIQIMKQEINQTHSDELRTALEYELQLCYAVKLNQFLLDGSNNSNDSVIAILRTNVLKDTEKHILFAYLNSKTHSEIKTFINKSESVYDEETKKLSELILLLSEIKQSRNKIKFTNESYIMQLEGYSYSKNELISSMAKSMLQFATNSNYSTERLVPNTSGSFNNNINGSKQNEIVIYPNPNTGIFVLKLTNISGDDTYELKVIDARGQLVKQESNIAGDVNKEISLDKNAKGIYLVYITSKKGIKLTKKLIVE